MCRRRVCPRVHTPGAGPAALTGAFPPAHRTRKREAGRAGLGLVPQGGGQAKVGGRGQARVLAGGCARVRASCPANGGNFGRKVGPHQEGTAQIRGAACPKVIPSLAADLPCSPSCLPPRSVSLLPPMAGAGMDAALSPAPAWLNPCSPVSPVDPETGRACSGTHNQPRKGAAGPRGPGSPSGHSRGGSPSPPWTVAVQLLCPTELDSGSRGLWAGGILPEPGPVAPPDTEREAGGEEQLLLRPSTGGHRAGHRGPCGPVPSSHQRLPFLQLEASWRREVPCWALGTERETDPAPPSEAHPLPGGQETVLANRASSASGSV